MKKSAMFLEYEYRSFVVNKIIFRESEESGREKLCGTMLNVSR